MLSKFLHLTSIKLEYLLQLISLAMRRILISLTLLLLMITTLGQNNTDPKDYEFYKTEFEKGTMQRNVGIGLIASGPVLFGIGVAMGTSTASTLSSNDFQKGSNIIIGFFVTAILVEVIGIPLCIAGASKRSKYKKLMDNYDSNISLYIRPMNQGIGFVFRF